MSEPIEIGVKADGKASIDGVLSSLSELQGKLSDLGRQTGGMKSLQAELERLRGGFGSLKGVGGSSLQELEQYRSRLSSALDSISQVVNTKKISPQYAAQLVKFGQEIKAEMNSVAAAAKAGAETAARAIESGRLRLGEAASTPIQFKKSSMSSAIAETVADIKRGQAAEIQALAEKARATEEQIRLAAANERAVRSAALREKLAAMLKEQADIKAANAKALEEQKAADARSHAEAVLAAQIKKRDAEESARAAIAKEIAQYTARPSAANFARQERVDNIFARAQAPRPAPVAVDINLAQLAQQARFQNAANEAMARGRSHASALGGVIKELTVHHQDLNSALRGAAQGFGVISAGLNSVVPLISSFAIASSFVKTLKVGAEFEKSMFTISELAGTASSEMLGLRDNILKMGAATQYGPLEVAKGLEVLTLAGLSAKQAISAVGTTLQFAAAGDIPLEKAAETLVAVGTAYRYQAQSFSVVGDLIAKTAADTMASVSAMAESFRSSSVVAQQYGVSLYDTAAALGALAQIGIKGTAAGTSFRNMIVELNKGTGRAADALTELDVKVKKLDGTTRPLLQVMRDLSSALVTRTGKAQQGLLDNLANERGAKSLAAFQAEALNFLAKTEPELQKQADAWFKVGNTVKGNEVLVKGVERAYAALEKQAEETAKSAQGFTFFANMEQALTPLGQFKGILASLETDFIKAFTGSSDAVYLLGVELRKTFNSPEFQSALSSVVSGITSFASVILDATKWALEHKDAVLLLAGAYLVLQTNVLRAGLFSAISSGTQLAINGIRALTAATAGLTIAQGLGAAATLTATTATAGMATAAASAGTAATGLVATLMAIPGAMFVIVGAIAALVAGLGYLAYKWFTAGDSAQKAMEKQNKALLEASKLASKALEERNKTAGEMLIEEVQNREILAREMEKGATQEQANQKALGEAAALRIQQQHAELILQKALNAEREIGGLKSNGLERQASIVEIRKQLDKDVLAQTAKMNEELARQATLVERLRVANAKIAEESKKQSKLPTLTGVNDKGPPGKGSAIQELKAAAALERAEVQKTLDHHKTALKEIEVIKAEGARKTAENIAKEKEDLAELDEAYRKSAAERRIAAFNVEMAAGGQSSASEVEAAVRLAGIQVENYRAELKLIEDNAAASKRRYNQEIADITATRVAQVKKLEGLRTELVAQKALLETRKDSAEHKRNYDQLASALDNVNAEIERAEKDTKALDAAQQALDDTTRKLAADFGKAYEAQKATLEQQILAAQKEQKQLQDTYRDRAKGTAEIERERAATARRIADELSARALEAAANGDRMAQIYEYQAQLARTKAGSLELSIAIQQSMNVEWYSAAQKALKDYASSLENVAGEIANVFTKSFKGLEDVLTDFITKGKADFKGFVKSILVDLARIAIRQNIIGPMVNGFVGGMAGGSGSIGSTVIGGAANAVMGGSGNLLSGIGNTVGGWFGATGATTAAGSAFTAGGAASGAFGVGGGLGAASGAAELAGTAATNVAAGSAATSGGLASGISSAIGAIPVWGWAIMAAAAIAALAGKGETRTGGQYSYSTDGSTAYNAKRGTTVTASGVGATFLEGPSGGTGNTGAAELINGAYKGINDLLKSLGSKTSLTGFQAGYETSDSGRGGVFAGGTLSTGKTFGESGKGDNYLGTLYEKTSSQDGNIEEITKNFVTDLKQTTLQALQAATDIPKLISEKLKNVDTEALTDSAVDQLMGEIQNIIQSVNSFRDTLNTLPFAELHDLSFDAAAGLIETAGGLEKLGNFTNNLSSYFDNFYSEQEKRQNTIRNITSTLNKAGLNVSEDQVGSATKETFRQIVEQYAAMGEQGRTAYLALLSVNQAFSDINASAASASKFLGTVAQYTETFSTKKELRTTAISDITERLNKNTSGIKVTSEQVGSATFKDFRAAVEVVKAMGPAGKSAYDALIAVNQEFAALGNEQIQLDELTNKFGDLKSAADELNPPAEKLVDSWRKNKSVINELQSALDDAIDKTKEMTEAEKAVAAVKKAVTDRDDLKKTREGLKDKIDDIRLNAATSSGKVSILKERETSLRDQFAIAPSAKILEKLTEVTLARIKAEAELKKSTAEADMTAEQKLANYKLSIVEQQIAGLEALKERVGELKQFVSDLKTGDLSALSPRDKLAQAKSTYEQTLQRAQSGDINALNNLQSNAQTYLGVAKTNYGTATSQYAEIFKAVTDSIMGLANSATKDSTGNTAIDLQLAEARKQAELLGGLSGTVIDTSKEEIAALEELGKMADKAADDMDKNIATLAGLAQEQIGLLQAVVDGQETELKVQIAKQKELIDVLDRIDENTDDTAADAAREKAKV